mgnify:CR=1 FL=1
MFVARSVSDILEKQLTLQKLYVFHGTLCEGFKNTTCSTVFYAEVTGAT